MERSYCVIKHTGKGVWTNAYTHTVTIDPTRKDTILGYESGADVGADADAARTHTHAHT